MSTTKPNTPNPALLKAEQTASQVFDDVDHLAFLGDLLTGEQTYQIVRASRKDVVTVTVSPDLATATLQWTRGKSKHGAGYRTFRIQGLPV
jgi:hypothetical protein